MRDGNGGMRVSTKPIGIELDADQEHVKDHTKLGNETQVRRDLRGQNELIRFG
jgi:hypothetical protein